MRIAVALGVVVALAVGALVVHRGRTPSTGLPAAQRIVADRGRFEAGPDGAQAIYDASRHLLEAAQHCNARAGGQSSPQCRQLFEAAAVGQSTAAALVHCQAPALDRVQRMWAAYLKDLSRSATSVTFPDPPRC
jgi:hypothetical protein